MSDKLAKAYELLEKVRNGLEWMQENQPLVFDESDGEMLLEIKTFLGEK